MCLKQWGERPVKKVMVGGERLQRALPVSSGDRSKKWRERSGGGKRRGKRRRPGEPQARFLADSGKKKASPLVAPTGEGGLRPEEGRQPTAEGSSGSKVNVYV